VTVGIDVDVPDDRALVDRDEVAFEAPLARTFLDVDGRLGRDAVPFLGNCREEPRERQPVGVRRGPDLHGRMVARGVLLQ
jgi:hypothetical protein